MEQMGLPRIAIVFCFSQIQAFGDMMGWEGRHLQFAGHYQVANGKVRTVRLWSEAGDDSNTKKLLGESSTGKVVKEVMVVRFWIDGPHTCRAHGWMFEISGDTVNAWRENEPEKDNPVPLPYFYDYLDSLAGLVEQEEAREKGKSGEP